MTTINIKKRLLVCLCIAAAFTLPGLGQNAKLDLDNLQKLTDKAAEVNDVTLDGAMLQFASKFLSDGDSEEVEIKSLLKNLKGIYIKSFEFDHDNEYNMADVEAIRSQLKSPGWSRMVESRSKRGREIDEIYLMKDGDKVAGLAIVVAEPRELTVVNIVGPIDLDKVSQLADHVIPHHAKRKNGQKPAKEDANEED